VSLIQHRGEIKEGGKKGADIGVKGPEVEIRVLPVHRVGAMRGGAPG
jgi:hypothetical protein